MYMFLTRTASEKLLEEETLTLLPKLFERQITTSCNKFIFSPRILGLTENPIALNLIRAANPAATRYPAVSY